MSDESNVYCRRDGTAEIYLPGKPDVEKLVRKFRSNMKEARGDKGEDFFIFSVTFGFARGTARSLNELELTAKLAYYYARRNQQTDSGSMVRKTEGGSFFGTFMKTAEGRSSQLI